MTIAAVIWDFGGVLTDSPFVAFNRYERENGLPQNFLRGVNTRNHLENAWARFERNEIDLNQFDSAFRKESAALGYPVNGKDVIPLLAGNLRQPMVSALKACKARLKVGCITNNVAAGNGPTSIKGGGGLVDSVARVFALFDHVIESSKAGLRKPDPQIYQMACDALGVAPPNTVYLDDLGINLKPARDLGMTTIKVVDPDVALEELGAAVGFPVR
ncbi:MAG: HAD-IA family hydrolase [Rhodospirillaceae bacterium]|nr:HAD-IA family hydrolase [Rhodospirillaceae bacterium]MCY4311722.1 HAD-IA family hydrolase [Rhodospirillaceae bacterium]